MPRTDHVERERSRALSSVRKGQFESAYGELERIAKIESVKASNAIEGIVTTDARLAELMQEGTAPLNHTEAEISGYRDCLNEIHTNSAAYDFKILPDISPSTVELVIGSMVKSGVLRKLGQGRGVKYLR